MSGTWIKSNRIGPVYFLLGQLLEDLDGFFQIVCEVHMPNVSLFPLQNKWDFQGDHALNETDVSLDTELSVMTLCLFTHIRCSILEFNLEQM